MTASPDPRVMSTVEFQWSNARRATENSALGDTLRKGNLGNENETGGP
jgi:hypothetical protein